MPCRNVALQCLFKSMNLLLSSIFPTSYLQVKSLKNATIFCNYTCDRKESMLFKATLLRGIEGEERVEVASVSWNSTFNSSQCNSEFTCGVKVSGKEKEITFGLQNLQLNQTDLYFCKIEILTPPYQSNISLKMWRLCPQGREKWILFITQKLSLLIIRKDYFNMTPWQSNGPKKRQNQSGVPARNYTAYRSWEP
uniref:Immunoglobulin V-set domain-containing protein n=1 Tax=Salvator merianae TaxID=96440 RepID=A0A8D0E6E9_SALMN